MKIHISKDLTLHEHCCENLKSCSHWILQKEAAPQINLVLAFHPTIYIQCIQTYDSC
jgi:hypothetical protein